MVRLQGVSLVHRPHQPEPTFRSPMPSPVGSESHFARIPPAARPQPLWWDRTVATSRGQHWAFLGTHLLFLQFFRRAGGIRGGHPASVSAAAHGQQGQAPGPGGLRVEGQPRQAFQPVAHPAGRHRPSPTPQTRPGQRRQASQGVCRHPAPWSVGSRPGLRFLKQQPLPTASRAAALRPCGHAPGHLSHCPRPEMKATALSKASLGWALCPVFPRWGHGIQCRWGPAYHGLVRMLGWAPGCPSAQTSLEGRVGWGWGPLDLPQLLAFWETCSHFRFRDGDSEAWRRELRPRHELVGEQLRSRRGPRLEPTVPHSSHALSRGSPTVP